MKKGWMDDEVVVGGVVWHVYIRMKGWMTRWWWWWGGGGIRCV